MYKTVAVKEYMNSQPAYVYCQTELSDVIEILIKKNVSGAPVIDKKKHVIGFISEQDCLKHLLLSSYHKDQPSIVNEVMHNAPLIVKTDDNLVQLAELMLQDKPKIYPVVKKNILVGSISRSEILKAFSKMEKNSTQW